MNVATRRGFIKSAPLAALAATATPALAFQAPITETPEPQQPEWWRKLVTELQQLRDSSPDHLGTGGRYIVVRSAQLDAILEEAMGGLV